MTGSRGFSLPVGGETSAGAQAKADAAQAAAATDATTKVAAHEADTTNVHGITDTSLLETTTGAQTKADAAQAAAVQRANHTGSQATSTVTGLDTALAGKVGVAPRVTSVTSSTTPSPSATTDDVYLLTALAAGATFAAPAGSPSQGQKLIIRIKDNGTARALAWNAVYRSVGATLPTTTVVSKTLYLGMMFNATDTKWDLLAVGQEA